MSVPQTHTLNSDSNSNGKVVAAAGSRTQVGSLNLRSSQAISLPGGQKHETLFVPTTSLPAWGTFYTIDIREKNIILNNITLQMVISPVTSSTTAFTGYFSPAMYFFTRIEIFQSGNIIDTLLPNEQFLRTQMLDYDEVRYGSNAAMGLYSSTAQRTLLSSQTGTNTFYIPLKSYFDECKPSLLTDQHAIQIRVYMDNLANVFTVTAGTLLSAPILSCTAICKVTRLDVNSAAARLQSMTMTPHHSIFHETRAGYFVIPAGTLSTNLVMAAIVGNVSHLLFVVRSSSVNAGAWNYTQLQSFSILDSTSTNITGGVSLPSSLCANVLNRDWCKSSYYSETSYASAVNNGANFYCWSFSADPVSALGSGLALTSRKMTGNEQLVLTFPAALTAQVSVDVYAYVESILEMTPASVKKSGL